MSDERSTLTGRLTRVARIGTGLGGLALKYAGGRVTGREIPPEELARDLKLALGELKGPVMKIAQILSSIPDMLPETFSTELMELQRNAPPMGPGFVRRRMAAELGPQWRARFTDFAQDASAAASLGQVHRAIGLDGAAFACKLQYPDMASAVEADLSQLGLILAIYKRLSPIIDPTEIAEEIKARLREELDYIREARQIALYRHMLRDVPEVAAPSVAPALSTGRLLTMSWLEGKPLLAFKEASLEARNAIAVALFKAWWHPFSRYGVIHGDPHLGNYSVREDHGINLLDYGSIRVFEPGFVAGVVDLYRAMGQGDREGAVRAFARWGFKDLSEDQLDALTVWARFIYGPLLEDRVRSIADGVSPGQYGRKEAFAVQQQLKASGRSITVPRPFVLMDRAAIGLGAVFLHLRAELNFHALFEDAIGDFDEAALATRQSEALRIAGL